MTSTPDTIVDQVEEATRGSLPPLDKWNPDLSGEMDLRINRDGEWIFQGSPIKRETITKLFSTILRREEDGEYYLITPVEKWHIQVDDTPLYAHTLEVTGSGQDQQVSLRTNFNESLPIGSQHPLRIEVYEDSGEPRPLVRVRQGFDARIVSSAYYEMARYAVEDPDRPGEYGLWSGGEFFPLAAGAEQA